MTEPFDPLYAALNEAIPKAIGRALQSYETFSQQSPEDMDPKSFSDHHKACKAALMHLDYLAKIVKWLSNTNGEQDDHEDNEVLIRIDQYQAMLSDARSRLIEQEDGEHVSS